MKNSNFFLLAITAATVVSCGTHPSSYTINGTVSDTTLNGNKVYLTDMASRNVLDSAVIANGKFTFTGKADTALICQIQSRPYRMELVLENGDIAVEMGETDKRSGTPLTEISLDEAFKLNPRYQAGDVVEEEVTPKNFGRIAAQNAKQVIVQRIREAERGMVYEKYSDRENDIVTGTIQRIEGRNIFVDLGTAEGTLLPNEQIPGETYEYHQRIKCYVVEVKKTTKGPQIILSRTHPGLLKRLFELEVAEIQDGTVIIDSVAREPGMRSKIAVHSTNPSVDPVGACVGPKGMRVQTVVDELGGEKIDIVKYSDNPEEYVASALSPSKVVSAAADAEHKICRVVVPDFQLSLAIGKEGQNARLAAKLTGWKIDIKSETQARESAEAAAGEENGDEA